MSKWIDASLQERTVMLQQVADCKGIVDSLQEGVTETTIYLERFFCNMLLGETTPLRNREMHLDWKPEVDFQSAKSGFQSANESVQSANPDFRYLQSAKIALWKRLQYFVSSGKSPPSLRNTLPQR